MTHRPRNCIIPVHMMEWLAKDRGRLGECAHRTTLTSMRIGERRALLRTIGVTNVAGTKSRTIYDAGHVVALPGTLVRNENDPPTADSAVNQVHSHLGTTYDFYRDVYRRNSLDDQGLRLDGTVHYGRDFMNAFWDGQQMVFGDGDGVVFTGFTGCVDIVAHELTHGVVQFTANLEYRGQSGALNESFADVFGSLVKQHSLGQTAAQADWLIGAGLLGPSINGKALRSMAAPGTAYDDPRLGRDPQPAHLSSYVSLPEDELGDMGGVHINSGIPNKAFHLLATDLGGNAWGVAGQIWYATLLQLWPTAQFQHCAQVSAEVASTLYGAAERQAVVRAWAAVGIQVPSAVQPPVPRPTEALKVEELQAACAALKSHLQQMEEAIHRAVAALS